MKTVPSIQHKRASCVSGCTALALTNVGRQRTLSERVTFCDSTGDAGPQSKITSLLPSCSSQFQPLQTALMQIEVGVAPGRGTRKSYAKPGRRGCGRCPFWAWWTTMTATPYRLCICANRRTATRSRPGRGRPGCESASFASNDCSACWGELQREKPHLHDSADMPPFFPPRKRGPHSIALMPADFMSCAHCGVSLWIASVNSAGEPAMRSRPRSASCLRTSGSASTRMVSA